MSIQLKASLLHDKMNDDKFEVGQTVIARFTNSGRINQFKGEIVGKTKNNWKIKAITSSYESEAPGRIFHIATFVSRIYSANNRIVELAE